MEESRFLLLKVLANKFHKNGKAAFLKPLPKEDLDILDSLSVQSEDAKALFPRLADFFHAVHYSWLVPYIEKMPGDVQQLIVSSLSQVNARGLLDALKNPYSLIPLQLRYKEYFLSLLYQQFKEEALLPKQYLPDSPLNVLLEFTKHELVELIDFLGMNDLGEDLMQIVDKRILKKVYSILSLKKQQYLKICLKAKERVSLQSLGLDRWDGDRKKLEDILHRRGLIRLGKALCGKHSHLLWYISHILDTGRGQFLCKCYSKDEIPIVTQVLTGQVTSLITFLKTKG